MTTQSVNIPQRPDPESCRNEEKSGTFYRYVLVSIVATLANLLLYTLFLRSTEWNPQVANAMAAILVVTPTFIVNRLWVWQAKSGSFTRQIFLYWLFSGLNVSAATLAARFAERMGADDIVLVGTTFGVYAALWLLRYLFLDALFTSSD